MFPYFFLIWKLLSVDIVEITYRIILIGFLVLLIFNQRQVFSSRNMNGGLRHSVPQRTVSSEMSWALHASVRP